MVKSDQQDEQMNKKEREKKTHNKKNIHNLRHKSEDTQV